MKQGREYWRRHVEAWGRGGQSKKAYCDQHGVSYWSMRYWTNKLSASAASPDQGLVELGPVGRLGADGEQRASSSWWWAHGTWCGCGRRWTAHICVRC